MPRTVSNKLTVKKIQSTLKTGRYLDGNGLYLNVTPSGTKSWVFRYTFNRKTREMGLGSIDSLSLAAARNKVIEARQMLIDNYDPQEVRRARLKEDAPETSVVTFKELAEQYIKNNEAGWKSDVHTAQWKQTLRNYAYPLIGHLPVDEITFDSISDVLMQEVKNRDGHKGPLWVVMNPTAANLRGRIHTILRKPVRDGIIKGSNPADLQLLLEGDDIPKNVRRTVKHHASMPYHEIPTFVAHLTRLHSSSARALMFTILTGARTSETLDAVWKELEIDDALWTIPAERMKAQKEHRVPLAHAGLSVIPPRQLGNDRLFPGNAGLSLSNMAMAQVMRKQRKGANINYTVHGFRSSLRDWLAECTDAKHEVAEMCLAHSVGSTVTRAYRRTDFIEQRRELMNAWAAHCLSETDDRAIMMQNNVYASQMIPSTKPLIKRKDSTRSMLAAMHGQE